MLTDAPELPELSRRTGVIALLVALATTLVAVFHRSMIADAVTTLSTADSEWLPVAGLGTVGLWVAGTASQAGTLPVRLPVGRLFAVQVAASFANHVAPAGVGGAVVNLRFLRRHGVAMGAGVAALSLNAAAGAIAHVLLLAALALFVPGAVLAATGVIPLPVLLWAGAAVLALCVTATVTARRAPRGSAVLQGPLCRVRGHLTDLRTVLDDRRRALALWSGALATPAIHVLVLYAVTQALGVPINPAAVGAVYLTVSTLSALVPAPGALGAFDVLLVAGLTAVGVPAASALAATVAYRLVTVWLPLVPAGCLLALLVRRNVI
ncbi:MAG TPA: lysylphosphatidylglycerol synthase transmembrane domain-containing protein [Sporichthya sp.]|nr:lysylphosphatidylglycerol synthase transmembrane domain-containing protein [Sporichthya sp.]